ncbi:MAG: CPBP family intramembrane metalloprotease [Sphingomonas sp.]|uniref:CPBP family intramembrane glutamic endopeptidase n=1 Tax=Sphingomonas sp. TaxID=28214 RepID=UPI001ACB1E86|nr:CPBP family intramembrane glutamic endopeptidase [Sphingomonas sp.]MBN8808725.1 CPBP family intramembrane metalloprotease [Sphingomonas sp.]
MTNLARSRALVRLDGPGHIMPITPVTPPDSKVWRVVHFPVMLAACALFLLVAAVLGLKLLGVGLGYFSHVPGARYLVPLIEAAAFILVYVVFVRIVERRRDFEELDKAGWLTEVGLGFGGGLALCLAIFGVQAAAGAVSVEGFTLSRGLLAPAFTQVCTVICLELALRGLFFRLAERLVGSWLALLASAAFFGGGVLLSGMPTSSALAAGLQSGLLFAAVYMVTRRLWAAIGLHAAIGVAQMALYGANGLVVSRVAGPDWLTGGAGGADASLPGLAITALLVATLLATAIRRGRIVRPIWQSGRSAPTAQPSFG